MIGTQADYARHAGVSRQAVSKMVAAGKIPKRPDGKIDFAEADFARTGNGDPARAMVSEGEAMESEFVSAGEPSEAGESGGGGRLNYTTARTATETYRAKLAKLEYEAKSGQLLSRADVENAMVSAGRRIREGLDGLLVWAEEIEAAARNGGTEGVRVVLRQRVRDLESTLVEALSGLAAEDGE